VLTRVAKNDHHHHRIEKNTTTKPSLKEHNSEALMLLYPYTRPQLDITDEDSEIARCTLVETTLPFPSLFEGSPLPFSVAKASHNQ
jgi:hypothetical protein